VLGDESFNHLIIFFLNPRSGARKFLGDEGLRLNSVWRTKLSISVIASAAKQSRKRVSASHDSYAPQTRRSWIAASLSLADLTVVSYFETCFFQQVTGPRNDGWKMESYGDTRVLDGAI
jgi:hypothetical protein